MHKFLKILLLIIFLWTLTLPWTFNYLSTISPLPGSEVERFIGPLFAKPSGQKDEKIVIGVVACGQKPLAQTIILLKSAILSSAYYGIPSLEFILFADDDHLYEMDLQLKNLERLTKQIKFRYEIHPVIFPAKNHDEWKKLFKPCASQRLFLHTALPHINEILYLDVDTLVVGDLREVWHRFGQMSSEQAVGLVTEHEVPSIGWYNRFAKHPFYPPLGLNTGVMLMNLTRLRTNSNLNWEEIVLNSFKKYKRKIVFGDQDLINIVFHQRPDAVYLLPCYFNYRTDHCIYGLNCQVVSEEKEEKGIQILHGSRKVFLKDKICPMFRKIYKYYEKFDMAGNDFIRDIVHPFKNESRKAQKGKDDKYTLNCDNIDKYIFNFYRVQPS